MAFDGIVISNIVSELKQKLTGGRISKIAQPEPEELVLTIKNKKDTYRLFLSANASLPLIYLTQEAGLSPMTAPNFCMLLRKHIGNARITDVTQPGLERIVRLELEHLDELGDLRQKSLVIEIMGKHSNIIFCDGTKIVDSIKHVSAAVSSVREVLPGRDYFIPNTTGKTNPLAADKTFFFSVFFWKKYCCHTFRKFYRNQQCQCRGNRLSQRPRQLSCRRGLHIRRTDSPMERFFWCHGFDPHTAIFSMYRL